MLTHNLRQLAKHSKVIALQQTRCQPHDDESLHSIVPHYKAYYSNYDRESDPYLALKGRENSKATASAGTAFLVSEELLKIYNVEHTVLIPGHAQRLDFVPFKNSGELGFSVYNIYLYTGSGNDVRVRQKMLAYLRKSPKRERSIFMGDWNFSLDPQDTSGKTCTDAQFLLEWQRFCTHFDLTELYQPTHTRYDWGGIGSSRIDRIYWNFPEAIWAVVTPKVFLPPISFNVHNTLQAHKIALAKEICKGQGKAVFDEKNIKPVSDHTPLAARFFSTASPKSKEEYSLPNWLADLPAFRAKFTEIWNGLSPKPRKSHDKLKAFKETVRKAGRWVLKHRQVHEQHPLTVLTGAIRLLRSCETGEGSVHEANSIFQKYPPLGRLFGYTFKGNKSDRDKLIGYMDDIAQDGISAGVTGAEEFPDGGKSQKGFFDNVKLYLPSTRTGISQLRRSEDEDPVTEPDGLASLVEENWTKVWAKGKFNKSKAKHFLKRYTKRILKSPHPPDLKDVLATIAAAKNSSAGPDGIPMAFYKALADIVGPILLEVVKDIQIYSPPNGFNHALLYILPKSLSDLLDKHRPISVPNADNIIVAGVFRRISIPVVKSFLEESQHAWIPGRRIQDPIKSFNKLFYEALENKEQLYLLLVDFAKAFDSVSHEFIFMVLEKLGFPQWYCNAVKHLLQGMGVFTTIRGTKRRFIEVLQGVKQGCPLSTIIFIIVMDPLLFLLRKENCPLPEGRTEESTPQGFADDTGVAFTNFKLFPVYTRIYDDFSSAVGGTFQVNLSKTDLLSTLPLCTQVRKEIQESSWPEIQTPEHALYLGVLTGRDVDTEMVYARPLNKFLRRIQSFSHVRTLLSTNVKVSICNVYLNSIFSYISPLLLPPESVTRLVRKMVGQFCIPFKTGQRCDSLLHPASMGGLRTPLKDLYLTSLAGLCKAYKSESTPVPSLPNVYNSIDVDFPRIDYHTHYGFHWAIQYDSGIGEGATQKFYYKALAESEYLKEKAFEEVVCKLGDRGVQDPGIPPVRSTGDGTGPPRSPPLNSIYIIIGL
jgi:hypothetical protein